MCIRGFWELGYEVGFARVCLQPHGSLMVANFSQESFNARLKAEGDEASTNLYVSNLPKTMTESVRQFSCLVTLTSTNLVVGTWCYLHGLQGQQ